MRGKQIYLLLTNTGTVLNRIIKAYTKAPYNHASIALDIELTAVYSFGRKYPSNPFRAGFVREDIHSRLFQQATCAVYALPVVDYQLEKMKRYIQLIEQDKENYHYHLLGLLGVLFNKPIERENAYFCSQFVATVLNECGISEFPAELSLTKPADLPSAGVFQLIYEGQLRDYSNSTHSETANLSDSCHSMSS